MNLPQPRLSRSRQAVIAFAALVLILFLFRPGVYRLRNRIATTIGNALGRRVALKNVHLRLLPRPGFDLEGLVIYDDPAFSEEPMIRAQEVSAAIRFRSLLRGRLEIATLSATEPSINLVRSNQGRWNLASLIERNAQIPAAPTGKPASERRPAFPYLEASNARINFKLGQTKKSYALINADVALWQDSENSWGARIKAEPVRTDFNLTDTGLLQIDATWQRAASLRSTPLHLAAQWRNGQLGQITKLLTGKDRGWRGSVEVSASLSGTPEALQVESIAEVDGFHRYDIVGSENVRLSTDCSGQYNAVESSLHHLLCESPVNGGLFTLRGNGILTVHTAAYSLTFSAVKVPLTSVVRLLRQAKKQIPTDLTATGLLNAEFRVDRAGKDAFTSMLDAHSDCLPHWSGTGSATDVRLLSNNGKDEVAFGTLPLSLSGPDSPCPHRAARSDRPKTREQDEQPLDPRLQIGPFALAMNASSPVSVSGSISRSGYRFFLRGDVALQDLFHLESVMGLPMTRPAAEGSAKLDVSLSGPWSGFAAAVTAGTAQLHNVRAEMRGLNTPVQISSAFITLTPDTLLLEKLSAHTGNTHWSGQVTALRHCAIPTSPPDTVPPVAPNCDFHFDLTADQFSTADLGDWFTPHPSRRPWYRILNSTSSQPADSSPLLNIQAHGTLHVGRFALKKVPATMLATRLEIDRGKIALTGLRTQLLQGTQQGNWTIDFSSHGEALHYHGDGLLQNISLSQMSTAMNDEWVTGVADGKFILEGSGSSFRDLIARSEGKLTFDMRNGALPRIEIPDLRAPMPVHRFTGDLHLKPGVWALIGGRLESRDGIYLVSGTASHAGDIDFVLTRGDEQSWTLTGTLAKPRVAAAARTEAQRSEAAVKAVKP